MLPELVGEDETTVAQANAVIEGATTLTNLLGPVAAGVLIAVIGATNVLYVDAATFLVSFLTLTLFVPRGRRCRGPRRRTASSPGSASCFATAALAHRARGRVPEHVRLGAPAVLPVLAFEEFSESSRVAGLFFASLGAGALVGSVLAMRLMPRFKPLRLAAVWIVAMTLPIWLLGLDLPLWAVMAALFVSAIPQPLVNAPVIGLMTRRAGGAAAEGDDRAAHGRHARRPDRARVAGPLLEELGRGRCSSSSPPG